MDSNKHPNRTWTQIDADGKRERSLASAGSENDLISIARAVGSAVFRMFAALTALTALMAFVTGCGSSSGGAGGAAESGRGRPAYTPVQNERFAVTTVELSAILLDNQKYARWTFGLKLKQPVQLRSIRIEDVTEGSAVSLVNDQAPQVQGSAWTGYTGAIEPSASALPWLFDSTPAKRTFRFTVTDLNGQDSVLEQTVTYPVKTKKDLVKWYGFNA
ncbi:MAG TPA: hypothetical protein VK673_20150 [Chthoniobacterales bacterium]|nr:hypothetical protein [Chthoniobacterales bacterium]